jgi:hypothetical protein
MSSCTIIMMFAVCTPFSPAGAPSGQLATAERTMPIPVKTVPNIPAPVISTQAVESFVPRPERTAPAIAYTAAENIRATFVQRDVGPPLKRTPKKTHIMKKTQTGCRLVGSGYIRRLQRIYLGREECHTITIPRMILLCNILVQSSHKFVEGRLTDREIVSAATVKVVAEAFVLAVTFTYLPSVRAWKYCDKSVVAVLLTEMVDMGEDRL